MRRLLALLLFASFACKDEVVVQRDLTGIDLTLRYDRSAGIDQIEVSGSFEDGSRAFEMGRLPDPPRPLTEGENNLVILLPDEMAGRTIVVRADGLVGGKAILTASIAVTPVLKMLVEASGVLGEIGACGDGRLRSDEACDDGNVTSGDGCSATCAVERGYTCSGGPSVCTATCGDGIIAVGAESCDDGGIVAGDGCSADCETEPGYVCSGEPSICTCEGDQDGDGVTDCEDACIDADGDGYGSAGAAGNDCIGADCDDTSELCQTTCDDVDGDAVFDCKDTCLDADGDGYGVAGGGGDTCTGPDCDDMVATCNTDCSANIDGDELADCADTCLDADGDGYGVAGGAGDECMGVDCNEGVATCNSDCTTDADADGTPDCMDGCIDADGDGYGIAGGGANACAGPDCDDSAATCNTDCTTDADADTVIDCLDTCIDADGDGYGVAGGGGYTCVALDCDDSIPTCTFNCTPDTDQDGIPDCSDTCIDRDGDGYGSAGGAGNTCLGPDCNDNAATCTNDCTTNVDGDGLPDCNDGCIDRDNDGRGTAGGAGNTCIGPDCDDNFASCTTNCGVDVDADGIADCADTCIDRDRDNRGTAGGAGNTCAGPDCNDDFASCTNNCNIDTDADGTADCADTCIDVDGDGYGAAGGAGNTCAGPDCDEARVACNVDCNACVPQALVLTTNSPRNRCTDVTLTVDLAGYDNAENQLACTAPEIDVLPEEDFDINFGRWGTVSQSNDVYRRTFPNNFPQPSCNTGDYVEIRDRGPDYFQLSTPINATNLDNLSIALRVGYRAPIGPGQNVSVLACCGAGCNPNTVVGTVPNGSSGGTNNCADYSFPLPAFANGCASLMIRIQFPNSNGRAGIDNVQVTGNVTNFGAFTELPAGMYRSMFRVCEPTTVPVTCTWSDGVHTPRSDTETVIFQ